MATSRHPRRTHNAPSKALGKRVRELRKAKKWTLETLAFRADMHVTYLSSIEHGARNPTLNVIVGLAQALSVSVSKLLEGVESRGGNER